MSGEQTQEIGNFPTGSLKRHNIAIYSMRICRIRTNARQCIMCVNCW